MVEKIKKPSISQETPEMRRAEKRKIKISEYEKYKLDKEIEINVDEYEHKHLKELTKPSFWGFVREIIGVNQEIKFILKRPDGHVHLPSVKRVFFTNPQGALEEHIYIEYLDNETVLPRYEVMRKDPETGKHIYKYERQLNENAIYYGKWKIILNLSDPENNKIFIISKSPVTKEKFIYNAVADILTAVYARYDETYKKIGTLRKIVNGKTEAIREPLTNIKMP